MLSPKQVLSGLSSALNNYANGSLKSFIASYQMEDPDDGLKTLLVHGLQIKITSAPEFSYKLIEVNEKYRDNYPVTVDFWASNGKVVSYYALDTETLTKVLMKGFCHEEVLLFIGSISQGILNGFGESSGDVIHI